MSDPLPFDPKAFVSGRSQQKIKSDGFDPIAFLSNKPQMSYGEQIEPGVYGETNPAGQKMLEAGLTVAGGYGIGQLAGMGLMKAANTNAAKSIFNAPKNIVGKIRDIRNAPKNLEEAIDSFGGKFGTPETPSMIGSTAKRSLLDNQAAEEALAQKLYERVPKDVTASTSRLSNTYSELADELPANIKGAVRKHVQLEPNPVRSGDVGEFKGYTTTTPDKVKIIENSLPDLPSNPVNIEQIPGGPNYGVRYEASPGTPTQLPPNKSSIGDLIKLRSKLGVAAKSGGIDGYNAGKLKAALDADIENLGATEGPLGKMTNEVVNKNLDQATSYYRGMMQKQSGPIYERIAKASVEDIPNIVFKGGRTSDVIAGRAALGETGYQAIKKSFFNEIANAKDAGKLIEKYSKNNSDFLQTVFNENELGALTTISNLQKKAMEAQKVVDRAKMLLTGTAATVVGGGVAGKVVHSLQ